MQEANTFRPRSGYTATLGAGATAVVTVPAGTRKIHAVCTGNAGRILVSKNSAAETVTATSHGYLAANIPLTIIPVPGAADDRYIHLSSTVAGNTFYITFGN